EQAKSQLWKIVNEFITARHNGVRPELQVALFEYGKSTLPASEGYIRQIQGFTTDLDKLSEELFALRTNGGDEYCGWVIKEAVERLAWSKGPNDFKAIFIAGNEPFTQGPVPYGQSCKTAVEKGIIVNTIHCGDDRTGITTKWQDGALLADGKYMVIDHNRAVVHFEAPQDKEIAHLGEELNKTYVAFGVSGRESLVRQQVQDANAASQITAGAPVQRALTKASANYRNSSWDLIDACKEGKVKLETLKDEDLPTEMKKMNVEQRKVYLEKQSAEREELQTKINRLNAERSKFVAEKNRQSAATDTLDAVMTSAIREQAAKRNYTFK
ncbi:MAG TPA: VWA domain-containing protein, partial [Candidatus Binatia bacterium]|nr:VWA domain-containing protein [Candidatus Binatia bacterium]